MAGERLVNRWEVDEIKKKRGGRSVEKGRRGFGELMWEVEEIEERGGE